MSQPAGIRSTGQLYVPSRAPYGPPALRIFAQTNTVDTDREPSNAEIAAKRFKERYNIRHDKQEHLNSPFKLHPNFCVSSQDRKFAHQEGMGDIEDAAVGAARLADSLFVGFGVRPDWDPRQPLHPDAVDIRVITTRQINQDPRLQAVVHKLERIVREELAIPHILAFRDKLDQVNPGPGYAFDTESRRIITHPVRLAPDVSTSDLIAAEERSAGAPVIPGVQPPTRSTAPAADVCSTRNPTPRTVPATPSPSTTTRTPAIAAQTQTRALREGRTARYPSTARHGVHRPATAVTTSRQSTADADRSHSFSSPGAGGGRVTAARGEGSAVGGMDEEHARGLDTIQHAEDCPASSGGSREAGSVPMSALRALLRVLEGESDGNSDTSTDDSSWLHTPAGSPPPSPTSPLSVASHPPRLSQRAPRNTSRAAAVASHTGGHESMRAPGSPSSPPAAPTESSNYYTHATVASFSFSRQVFHFVAEHELSVQQCARIALALDYHVQDWEVLFQQAGLSASEAVRLRRVVFSEVPAALREVMDVVRPLLMDGDSEYDSDTVSSVNTSTNSHV